MNLKKNEMFILEEHYRQQAEISDWKIIIKFTMIEDYTNKVYPYYRLIAMPGYMTFEGVVERLMEKHIKSYSDILAISKSNFFTKENLDETEYDCLYKDKICHVDDS
jgi:hypothetical protein